MFDGVDKPVMPGFESPPQALIKLREIIIKNFFIDLSDYVISILSNKRNFAEFVT